MNAVVEKVQGFNVEVRGKGLMKFKTEINETRSLILFKLHSFNSIKRSRKRKITNECGRDRRNTAFSKRSTE
jgi:hypothetical protein